MEETKVTKVVAKSKSREEMTTSSSEYVLKDRELLVETEGSGDTFVARFKVGDGITPYSKLPYISNLYKIYPNFILYNEDYSFGININLKNDKDDK